MIAEFMAPFARRLPCHIRTWGLLSLIAVAGCDNRAAERSFPGRDAEPLTVNVITVGGEQITERTSVIFGKLQPEKRRLLRFSRPGRIATVNVNDGETVVAGQLLATIDQAGLDQQTASLNRKTEELKAANAQASPQQQPAIRTQLAEFEGQLAKIESERKALSIIAPFDGVIWKSNLSVGETANPSTSTIDLVSNNQPFIAVSFTEEKVQTLKDDQVFWVSIGTEIFRARLITAMQDVDTSRDGVLQFESDVPPDLWQFDTVCEIRFQQIRDNAGVWVPLSSISSSPAGFQVLTVLPTEDGNKLESRQVTIRQIDRNDALVTGEIESGDLIVSSGGHRVVSGQIVSIRTSSDFAPQVELPQ